MKVRVTYEVSDDALLGIGIMHKDQFKPAKQADARAYLQKVGDEQLAILERGVAKARDNIDKVIRGEDEG